ncbi:hypothetical protein Y032_0784g2334 [Ancylostoma ceylanicum]|uniref:Uncharacterized protein n=1 Tax=Ancylostoma ceylanicum TaxID=53326 RepID=A0A016WD31_9BILA|nr:hypothetical protein Y032_0784g2334 [Ancylostoma ceylanicum]
MPNGRTIRRPLNKIFPLEIRSFPSEDENIDDEDQDPQEDDDNGGSLQQECEPECADDHEQEHETSPQNLREVPGRQSKTRAYDAIRFFEESLEEPGTSTYTAIKVPYFLAIFLTLMCIWGDTTAAYVGSAITCANGTVGVHPPYDSFMLCFDDQCRSYTKTSEKMTFQLPLSPHQKRTKVILKVAREKYTQSVTVHCDSPNFCDARFLS